MKTFKINNKVTQYHIQESKKGKGFKISAGDCVLKNEVGEKWYSTEQGAIDRAIELHVKKSSQKDNKIEIEYI